MNFEKKFNKNLKGFTIVELIIVLIILSILVGLAIPEYMDAKTTSKAAQCGAALRGIESAKNMWKRDYPGVPITSTNQLLTYFPGNAFPQDPWGVGFDISTITNIDPTVISSHPYNGVPSYEPRGNCSTNNGYNDAYQISH